MSDNMSDNEIETEGKTPFDFELTEIAETVKYKYECGENQIHPALVGISNNLILFPWNSSAGRLYMAGNMIPKSVPTKGAGERMMVTGFEFQYAKTARRIEAPANMEVEEIFYVNSLDPEKLTDDWNTIRILYKNDEKNAYDILELPKYNTQNTYVGFEYVYDQDVMRKLKKGATFPKGTVFARSPRISKNGEWCFAMPTLVAALSDYRTEEDGVIMTRSFAERSRCMFKHDRSFGYNEDEWIPLMLYGTDENPSPFPQAGEEIRNDGIVMGFRRRIKENALVSLTKKSLREPDLTYDKLFYAPRDAVVMSVTVKSERMKNRSNNRGTDYIEQRHNTMLDRHEKKQNEMWNNVTRWYEMKTHAARNNEIPISKELDTFIRNAYGNYTRNGIGKINPLSRAEKREKLKDWNIHIELKQSVAGRVKWKYAGLNGDKGVNVLIIEDHEAPCYPDGTRAEFIVNNTPAFRRQIFSMLMELSINFVNMNVHREVKHLRRLGDYKTAYFKLMEFYETGFPEFAETVKMALVTDEEKQEHVDYVCKNKISVHVISNTKLFGVNIINALRKKYSYKPQKAMFVNSLGERVETTNPILISYQDIMLLDKFGADMSAQSMPKSNLFGMPAKMNDSGKYATPMTDKGNKNSGETELRLEVSQAGGQEAEKHLALAYSPENRAKATRRLIRADDPFNVNQLIKPEEYLSNRALKMSLSMMSDSGYTLRRERATDRRETSLDRAYNTMDQMVDSLPAEPLAIPKALVEAMNEGAAQ
mgnify:CR=1 FL=1